jgi:fibro-slime domain-containing protein
MLAIGRDGPLPINRLDVEVTFRDQTLRRTTYRLPEEATLPTTLAIASNGDATASVTITVVAWDDDVPLDRRDAIVTQIPTDRVALLNVVLSGRCSGLVELDSDGAAVSTCGDGKTCDPAQGDCADAAVDAKSLPSYQSGDEDQIGAAGAPVSSTGGATTMPAGGEGPTTSAGSPPMGAGGAGGAGGSPSGGGEGGTPSEPFCGDSTVQAGETCDDGNLAFGDGCTGNCAQIEDQFSCDALGACLPQAICGNGKLETPFEACDDANETSDDGCSSTCQHEAGFACARPGRSCSPTRGDGLVKGTETCDDGNMLNGDGCAAGQLEPGYACEVPGTPCVRTTCGDGDPQGHESCDDGNATVGDGCSPFCQKEPVCPKSGGACAAACGDGIKDPAEECDGGGPFSVGCDAACKVRRGFDCAETTDNPFSLPIVYRDFIAAVAGGSTKHPDFEAYIGAKTGMVQNTLGPGGVPLYSGVCAAPCPLTSGATFAQWFVDTPGVNLTQLGSISLSRPAAGVLQFDTSSFFPLDGKGWVLQGKEAPLSGHNFGFTSELRFRFVYQGGEVIDFIGDDDVWAFVAGRLAIDLGGVHGAINGSVTLNAAFAAAAGLVKGSVYEVAIFQAERHTTQSNYKLTLQGFAFPRSTCVAVCGDGIVTADEECDDPSNTGNGYGQCKSDCKLGPGCGDNVEQAPEECDVGSSAVVYGGCAADCTLRECGDDKVQSGYEECDDGGVLAGDGCDATCQLE